MYTVEPIIKSIVLIGILLLFGSAFFNIFILKPISLSMLNVGDNNVWQKTIIPRNIFALIAFLITLIGSALQLILHTSSLYEVTTISSFPDSALSVFYDTTWGKLAWAKLCILITLPVSYSIYRYKQTKETASDFPGFHYILLATCVLYFIAHSLSGHNAAISSLYYQGIVINIIHIVFSGIWTGSVITLTIYCHYLNSKFPETNLSDFIKLSFFKFRAFAILSIVVLSITGLYVAWMQVNKPEALFTLYGISIILKVLLIGLAVFIAGVNTYIIIKFFKSPTSMTRIAISLITIESCLLYTSPSPRD